MGKIRSGIESSFNPDWVVDRKFEYGLCEEFVEDAVREVVIEGRRNLVLLFRDFDVVMGGIVAERFAGNLRMDGVRVMVVENLFHDFLSRIKSSGVVRSKVFFTECLPSVLIGGFDWNAQLSRFDFADYVRGHLGLKNSNCEVVSVLVKFLGDEKLLIDDLYSPEEEMAACDFLMEVPGVAPADFMDEPANDVGSRNRSKWVVRRED